MLENLIQRSKNSIYRRIGRHFNYTKSIKFNDTVINIPSINGIKCEITEIWMLGILETMFNLTDGVFFDIGVNVGQTLIKVKSIDKERKYVGFEPNPMCVYYIHELVRKNKFNNTTIFPVGLFNKDGILSLEFFSDDVTDSSASLINGFRPNCQIVNRTHVPVFNIKSIAEQIDTDNVSIIKIDVEGAELEVIKSIESVIRSCRPFVLMEILPAYANNTFREERQKKIEDFFHSLEYSFYRIEKMQDNSTSLKKIEFIGVHSDLNQSDYMVVPNELIRKL